MIPMKMVEKSSRIAAYGYDAATQTLSVQFKNGPDAPPGRYVYDYQNVPPKVYEDLEAAESKGSFITTNLVRGKPFEFQKIDTAADTDGEALQKAEAA